MEQTTKKKLFHVFMIIVIIAVILFTVGIIIIRYQVEGETNLPFDISKIAIISAVDSVDNKDEVNKWNLTVNQNNDVYIYIDKNNNYNKTEIIDSIDINNITIDKQTEKGEITIYKPTEKGTAIFENVEENKISEITYTGDLETNIKGLKISNQGGIIVLRFANNNAATYISNEAQEVNYSKLLQETNANVDDLKATITFDLSIKLTSGRIYKAGLTINIPVENVIENGTTSQEITDTSNIVFKRIENN